MYILLPMKDWLNHDIRSWDQDLVEVLTFGIRAGLMSFCGNVWIELFRFAPRAAVCKLDALRIIRRLKGIMVHM